MTPPEFWRGFRDAALGDPLPFPPELRDRAQAFLEHRQRSGSRLSTGEELALLIGEAQALLTRLEAPGAPALSTGALYAARRARKNLEVIHAAL